MESLQEVTLVNDVYHIQLLGGETDRIIFNYLWTELNEVSGADEAFRKWLLVAKVYSGVFHPFLEGLTEDSKQSFLNQLMILIEGDDYLKNPLHILENQWRCDSHFESFFYQRNSAINLSINSSSRESTSTVTDGGVTQLTLKDIQEKYIAPDECLDKRSLISISEDWIIKSNTHEYGRGQFYSYYGFPQMLVSSDILINHVAIYDYGKVSSLIEMSRERIGLKHVLFNVLPSFDNFDFLLYLLCSKNTSALALFLIIDHAPRMFTSHRLTGETTFSTVLNLACNEFISIIFEGDSEISKNDVVELIIALAKRAINEETSFEYSVNKKALDILLQELSIKQVEIIAEDLLEYVVQDNTARNNNFPCWKYYLLFWLLEKNQTFGVLAEKDFSERVQMSIGNEYLLAFTSYLEPKDYPFGAIKLFDILPWERVNSHSFIDVILSLVDHPRKWIRQHILNEESNYYTKLRLVESYLQILLLLNQSSDEQDRILKKVLVIVRVVGFSCEHHENGVFNNVVNNNYPLWKLFSRWVERLSDERFSDLITDLGTDIPLDKLFEMYGNTNKDFRRSELLTQIKMRSIESESMGLDSIESALCSALDENEILLAKSLVDKGDQFLLDRFGGDNESHHVKERKSKWMLYRYKVELLTISNDESLGVTEKVALLRALDNPFNSKVRSSGSVVIFSGVGSGYEKVCVEFRRSVIAVTIFDSDPEISYSTFDDLFKKTKKIHYADNRFASKLNKLDQENCNLNLYRHCLSEWTEVVSTEDFEKLNLVTIQNWLHCLYKLKLHSDIDRVWLSCTAGQKRNILIATNYCLSLKDRGSHYEAKSIFEGLQAYHGLDSLSEEADRELKALNDLILNNQEPLLMVSLSKKIIEEPRSKDELRRSYHEIMSKSDLADVVSIISDADKVVGEFLYDGLINIFGEIQLRKKNLQQHKKKVIGMRGCRITQEDLINDWVTSIFDQKYAYLSLSCRDQKRGGQSKSQKNPGEIDFFICDRSNSRIAIMEAFNLSSNDRTVINTHLDKIAGYDQECLDTVFIIGYCDVTDFPGLCKKYENDTKTREYSGFTEGKVSSDKLVVRENSDTLKTYVEVRYRGEKPITIYHLMLNLRFSG